MCVCVWMRRLKRSLIKPNCKWFEVDCIYLVLANSIRAYLTRRVHYFPCNSFCAHDFFSFEIGNRRPLYVEIYTCIALGSHEFSYGSV